MNISKTSAIGNFQYNKSIPKKRPAEQINAPSFSDVVEANRTAASNEIYTKKALTENPVDYKKIDRIKQQIELGSYTIDDAQIAKAILGYRQR